MNIHARSKRTRALEQHRQSPMKNLEVKFSLSELEFHCIKTCFWYGESVGEQEFDGRIFHMYPPPLHGRSYEKSRKMSRDRTVDLKNDCNRNRECLESWAPSERTLKDAKSVTPSSKSVTHGRPRDTDSSDTLGASCNPALTVLYRDVKPCAPPHRFS